MSAAYIFRVVALAFDRARIHPLEHANDPVGQWLALLPALLVWVMALAGDRLLQLLGGGGV